MRHKVHKFILNYEKEELWLNDMAKNGKNFVGYNLFSHTFEEGTPGEYIYRIELLDQAASHPDSVAYIRFMELSGVTCVATYHRWVYFRKKASEGPFDIYSDFSSRLKHYRSIMAMQASGAFCGLSCGALNFLLHLNQGAADFSIIIGIVCLSGSLILMPSLYTTWRQYRRLKQEVNVYES